MNLKRKFLIVMADGGMGTCDIGLVSEEAGGYLESPSPAFDSNHRAVERVPGVILGIPEEFFDVDVTSGSCKNDRAAHLIGFAQSFDSIADLFEHCSKNDVQIVGEFVDGCC